MAEVADLWVKLSLLSTGFSGGLLKAGAEAEGFTGKVLKVGDALAKGAEVGAVAAAGLAVASVKMASDFQRQMELLATQAGVPQEQIAGLSKSVLGLAGQVGFSPQSLAEALFHVESSFASVGISGQKAMDLLKVAAEGAQVGHANLVDVTNALDAAVVSGIPGVQDYNKAMGVLNATVGAGDMTMQDLADAFGTGMLATVKGFGLSITDVGAALAVFGDNNIRGAVAATDLRMAVEALAKPVGTGEKELRALGLTTHTLAEDMQSGGLLKALLDLKAHMDAAGVSAVEQGKILTDVFGKRAGVGLNVLYDQLDRLKSKYPDLTAGANGFADAWERTKQTLDVQFKQITSGLESLGIKFGTWLIPKVSAFIDVVQREAGPVVRQFAQDVHDALDSPAVHQAEGVLRQVWQDLVRSLRDAAASVRDLWAALQPTAAFLAGVFLAALRAVGVTLADVVGPTLRAVTGFLRDHAAVVRDVVVVALGLLAAKLLYVKTLAAIDMFTTFVNGIGKAVQGVKDLAVAVKTGAIFDTFKLKVAAAGDALKGLAASEGEAAAAGAAAAGERGFGALVTKLGGAVPIAGAFVLAGVGIVEGLRAITGFGDKTAQSLTNLTTVMLDVNQGSAAAKSYLADVAAGLMDITQKVNDNKPVQGLRDIDSALAQMVSSGHADQAQASVQLITDRLQRMGVSLGYIHDQVLPQYYDSLRTVDNQQRMNVASTDRLARSEDGAGDATKHLANAQDAAGTATDDLAAKTSSLTSEWDDAKKAASDYSDRLEGMFGKFGTYSDAQANLTIAMNDAIGKITRGKDAVDLSTVAGAKNFQEFEKLAKANTDVADNMVKTGSSADQATAALQRGAKQIDDLAKKSGLTEQQIKDLNTELFGVPSIKEIKIDADIQLLGLDAAMKQLNDLNAKRLALNSSVLVAPGGGRALLAAGGPVVGPGTKTSDSVPIMASAGEFMMPAAAVDKFGLPFMEAIRNGQLPPAAAGSYALPGGMPGGAGGTTVVNNYITVQGSVIAERDVLDLVETEYLQRGGRRPATYAPYHR